MAKPTLASSSSGGKTAGGTTLVVAWPTGIQAGDLLLAWTSQDNTLTLPGFTSYGVSNNVGNVLLALYGKIADGTESGNFTMTTVAATNCVVVLQRWINVKTTSLAVACTNYLANTNGAGTTAIPPAQTGVPNSSSVASGSAGGAGANGSGSVTGTNWILDKTVTNATFIVFAAHNLVNNGSVPAPTMTTTVSCQHANISITINGSPRRSALIQSM